MEYDFNILMIFAIKEKIYNFDPYNVLLAISTNIPVLLMTAFVLQTQKRVSPNNCKSIIAKHKNDSNTLLFVSFVMLASAVLPEAMNPTEN